MDCDHADLDARSPSERAADRRVRRAGAAVSRSIGLYGVMAFQVAQRTREMGVRLALGASRARRARPRRRRERCAWSVPGSIVGLWRRRCCSAGRSRRSSSRSRRAICRSSRSVPAVLAAAAALASYLPARRATRVDPVIALRGDAIDESCDRRCALDGQSVSQSSPPSRSPDPGLWHLSQRSDQNGPCGRPDRGRAVRVEQCHRRGIRTSCSNGDDQ